MLGKRIILFLFPLLIIFIKFCFTNEIKQLTKNNSLITDEEIKEDIKVVDLAIQAPWVEQNPLGIQRMETKREYFGLSDAQKALFNRHWELETIQLEKPSPPKQLNLELFSAALNIVVEMKHKEKEVWLRMDKLNKWLKEEEEEEKEIKNKSKKEEELNKGNNDYITLTKLFKLDTKENKKEEEKEGQCSENEKQKFIKTNIIEQQQQQQQNNNRTETIYENINGISGNWWHLKQPIEEKKIEKNNEKKPLVMIIVNEENNKKENEEKEEKEEKGEKEVEKEIKDIKEEQNNNIIQEESNETEIFDQIQKRKYPFRAERPSEMVLIDMNSNGKDFGWNSEENEEIEEEEIEEEEIEEEEEEEEEKVKPMVEVVEIIDINKEKEREEEDESIIINSSSTSEEEEEIKKEIQPQPNGILNVLSNILFGGNNRFKREAIPLQIIQNSTKIDNNNNINEYITIKGKNFEFSASKMEIIKDLNKKEEKSENKKDDLLDNVKNIENLKKEEEISTDFDKINLNNNKIEEEKQKIKKEKYKIAKYLSEYLSEYLNKTSKQIRKRDEKIAYVWYCELQYWLAKRVEKDFGNNEKDNGKNVAKILDEMDNIINELEYIRLEWGKIIGKIAVLTNFIGKEFKRKK